jgi:hypothetical protein
VVTTRTQIGAISDETSALASGARTAWHGGDEEAPMSTYGVRRRFVDVLVRDRGRMSEVAFTELVAYARERGITAGEAKALLQPAAYLRTSGMLRTHGVRLDDVRLDDGAWAAAEALGRELDVTALFPDLPNARPTAAPAPTPAPAEIPAGGQRLGEPASWRLETSGAVLTFATRVGDRTYPALVLASPAWKDPGPPRDLVAEHRGDLEAVTSLAGLVAFVREVVAEERAYFEAEGIEVRFANERYAIQDARRHEFFEALAGAAGELRLAAGERDRIPAVLAAEKERLLCDRDYDTVISAFSDMNAFRILAGAPQICVSRTAHQIDRSASTKCRLSIACNNRF